ncbi:hypothetical protein RJ55_04593 [Drechmeria coniospora]|nr:hypothetical protein RJ55_04593 [Drechmeria coniospora]
MALLLRLAGGFGVVLLLLLLLAGLIYYLCLLPPTEPRGIPSIPFWVALLPLVKDVDQQVVFARYIEKPLRTHGAVKIFFASKWNLLLHRPALLADLFKHEDRYQKSGNQKKIPGSVLASFLGDNIISSHGQIWKSYRQIIQPGLQRQFDLDVLLTNADRLCDMLVDSQADKSHNGDGISVQASIQRHTIANFAQVVYEVDLGTLRSKAAYLDHLQRRIKREIFKPIFMNFPFLDRLGFPSRRRARLLAAHFTDQLVEALERAHPTDVKEPRNLPCSLLAARKTGELTEQQFRDNVTVLFVAGQENPQLAILSTMYLLAKHPVSPVLD